MRRFWTALRLVPCCDSAAKTAAYTALWVSEHDRDSAHLVALDLVDRLIVIGNDEPTVPRGSVPDHAEDPSTTALAGTGGSGLA